MQFVPINPSQRTFLEDMLEVKRLAAVRAARPVQQRTLPPLLVLPRAAQQQENLEQESQQQERRHAVVREERRKYCRRVQHLPVLVELRSAIDRRKNAQRKTDWAEHIDVEA
jgi:hypothetical protein